MSKQQFLETVSTIADRIGDKPLDDALAAYLNSEFPVGGALPRPLGRAPSMRSAGPSGTRWAWSGSPRGRVGLR